MGAQTAGCTRRCARAVVPRERAATSRHRCCRRRCLDLLASQRRCCREDSTEGLACDRRDRRARRSPASSGRESARATASPSSSSADRLCLVLFCIRLHRSASRSAAEANEASLQHCVLLLSRSRSHSKHSELLQSRRVVEATQASVASVRSAAVRATPCASGAGSRSLSPSRRARSAGPSILRGARAASSSLSTRTCASVSIDG